MGANLREADLAGFARLRIPPELLAEAGVCRVTDAEARDVYGIRGGGDMSGIAFPYFEPSTMSNGRRRWYVRIRRDHPNLEDGKEKKKYVAPYGDRKHLYFPPRPELFADASTPIVLVEAEKSALALTAWAERTGRKLLALAMGGCWGWRGQVGIKDTGTGERVPEHGAIPDLGICREGRLAYVLLDANCATNPSVQAARRDLVLQLRKQSANVRILDLPAGAWNGPDDFIAVTGDEAMLGILQGAESGATILDDLETFLRRFVVMSEAQFIATVLWCVHTYAFEVAIWTPYLAVTSAEKRCAKSRLLETVGYLVRSPWQTSSATPASLFREIDKTRPTLLLDELDALFKGDKELAQTVRAVLNSGAHYKGRVSRVVGKGTEMTTKNFQTYCPKALAGIGSLPDTVADRSLPIRLKRKMPFEKVDRLRERVVDPQAAPLRKRLADWVAQQLPALKVAEPEIPQQLNDRQQDGAECLLAIADIVGGKWPSRARRALVELYTGESADDQSSATLLLSDIRDVFERLDSEVLSSVELIEQLINIDHGIWAEYHNGKPIGTRALSKLLGDFGIGPRAVRRGDQTPRGYRKDSFRDAWERYTPVSPPLETQQAQHSNAYAPETQFLDPQQEPSVAHQASEESPVLTRGVADVADKSEGIRHDSHKEPGGIETQELPCEIHGRHTNWWIRIESNGGEMVCAKCYPEPIPHRLSAALPLGEQLSKSSNR
jgi:hypothetical protein